MEILMLMPVIWLAGFLMGWLAGRPTERPVRRAGYTITGLSSSYSRDRDE